LLGRVFGTLALAPAWGGVTNRLIARRLGQNGHGQNWNITIEARDGRDKVVQSLHSDKQDIRFQEGNNINKDKGALLGPFLHQYGRSTPAHQSASWRCLRIFLPDVSPKALEQSSRLFLEPGLAVRYIPNLGGLVSSKEGLCGLANGWPRRFLSSPALSNA
jgi:hypothetical protein